MRSVFSNTADIEQDELNFLGSSMGGYTYRGTFVISLCASLHTLAKKLEKFWLVGYDVGKKSI